MPKKIVITADEKFLDLLVAACCAGGGYQPNTLDRDGNLVPNPVSREQFTGEIVAKQLGGITQRWRQEQAKKLAAQDVSGTRIEVRME